MCEGLINDMNYFTDDLFMFSQAIDTDNSGFLDREEFLNFAR